MANHHYIHHTHTHTNLHNSHYRTDGSDSHAPSGTSSNCFTQESAESFWDQTVNLANYIKKSIMFQVLNCVI